MPTGYLTLATGRFSRSTQTTAEGLARTVSISGCPVTQWSVMSKEGGDKLDCRSFTKGETFDVTVEEHNEPQWGDDPEKFGELYSDYHARILVLPGAFAHFWSAAGEASGGSIRLALKTTESDILKVTHVGLFDEQGPVHPVVTEMRSMREELRKPLRLLVGFFIFAITVLVLLNFGR